MSESEQAEISSGLAVFSVGDVFENRYKIMGYITGGGMAHVYHGIDLVLHREIVLKVLKQGADSKPSTRERFKRETKALASLEHPNIVKFYNSGITDADLVYVVMEFVPGESLQSLLTRNGYLTGEQFLSFFIQMLSALRFVHEQNIVHRDIKPANIMVNDNNIKLIDFGIARILGQESDGNTSTQNAVLLGTPTYMSPEQCKGERGDRSSDFYSVACVMYECITSRTPFTGGSPYEVMFKHMSVAAPKLVPMAKSEKCKLIAVVIDKCLAKNPKERPESAESILSVLEECNGIDLSEFRRARAGKIINLFVYFLGITVVIFLLSYFMKTSRTAEKSVQIDHQQVVISKRIQKYLREVEVLEHSEFSSSKGTKALFASYVNLIRNETVSKRKSDALAAVRHAEKAIQLAKEKSNDDSIRLETAFFLCGMAQMKAGLLNDAYKSFLHAKQRVESLRGESVEEERFELLIMLANIDLQLKRFNEAMQNIEAATSAGGDGLIHIEGYFQRACKLDSLGIDKVEMLNQSFLELMKSTPRNDNERACLLKSCYLLSLELHDIHDDKKFKQANDYYQKEIKQMVSPSADFIQYGTQLQLMENAKESNQK